MSEVGVGTARLREAAKHLEAIRDAACEEYQSPDSVPSFEVIRGIYSDAVAALALLVGADEAHR